MHILSFFFSFFFLEENLTPVFLQMTDVEAGGATVFPDFGAAIWPRKVKGHSATIQNTHICWSSF